MKVQKVRIVSQETGSSIIQVLVASGIMGILMMGMLTMFKSQSTQSSQLQRKVDGINLENLMNSAILKDEFCACNFGPLTLNTGGSLNLTTLKLTCAATAGEGDIVSVNQPVSNGSSLVVDKIRIENVKNVGAGVDYFMELVISFQENRSLQNIKPLRVGFFGSVNPGTMNIQSCRPQATTMVRDMCQTMGGTYNTGNGRCVMPPPQVIVQQVMIPTPATSNPNPVNVPTLPTNPSIPGSPVATYNPPPAILVVGNDPCATATGLDKTYCQNLGRMPDEAGKEFWLDKVNSGTITMAEAEKAIANSSEAAILKAAKEAGLNVRSVQEISGVVDTDVQEIDRQTARTGVTRKQIEEYTKDTITGDPEVAAINDLYRQVAGRQADATGAAWWAEQIRNGNATMEDLKKGLEGEVSARGN